MNPPFKIGDPVISCFDNLNPARPHVGNIEVVDDPDIETGVCGVIIDRIDDEPDEIFTNLVRWEDNSESWISSCNLKLK